MSAASSSRPVPDPHGDRDSMGAGTAPHPPAWQARGAPAPPARAGPPSSCPLPTPPAQHSPSLLPCRAPMDGSGHVVAGGAAPQACAAPRPPAWRSQPPTPAVPGSSIHSHRLPPTPSPFSLTPQPCHAMQCHAMPCHATPCHSTLALCLRSRGWEQTAPRSRPHECSSRGLPSRRGLGLKALAQRGPAFPCSLWVSPPCAILPVTPGKELLHEGAGGATSAPRDPGARLLPPGRGRRGWDMAPARCSLRPWGPGPGGVSCTHRLPLPDQGRCPAPRAWPQRRPAVQGQPHPLWLMKPLWAQGTHLLPQTPLAASQQGGGTCVLAVRGRR